jgi:hypothetical protein
MGLLGRGTGDEEAQTLIHEMPIVDFASSVRGSHFQKDAPVGEPSASSASADMDKDFILSVANCLQALLCLSNLMSAQADDPAKVRVYANLVEQRLQALSKLLSPMLWEPA